MSSLFRNHRRIGALVALAAAGALAACSDSGPTAPKSSSPGFAVTGGDIVAAHVKVCVDDASPAGTYTFDRSASPTTEGTFSVSDGFSVAVGACVDIWSDDAATTPTDPTTDVTVTSASMPANTEISDITVNSPFPSTIGSDYATTTANAFHGSVIIFTFAPTPPPGDEGCTPGYWKQSQHFDSWPAAYAPTDLFSSVFTVPGGFAFQNPESGTDPNTLTLVGALGLNGGGANSVARSGTAALLNAESGDVAYPYTVSEVIDMVNGVLDGSYSASTINDQLDGANNGLGGCPLN